MSVLGDARERMRLALGEEWQVFAVMPDAIPGPCFAVVASTPALEPLTVCNWTARFDVLAVAGRLSVEDAQRTLDEMVEYLLPRLREASGFSIERGSGDEMIPWGNVNYLTRRVTLWTTVTI